MKEKIMPTKGFPYTGMACGCDARSAKHERSLVIIGFFTVCGAELSVAVPSANTRLLSSLHKPDFVLPAKSRRRKGKNWRDGSSRVHTQESRSWRAQAEVRQVRRALPIQPLSFLSSSSTALRERCMS